MSQFEQDKALFIRRVRCALPVTISFVRSEFQQRCRASQELIAKLEREIEATRAEAQETALQIYLLAQDRVSDTAKQADDLLMLTDGEK